MSRPKISIVMGTYNRAHLLVNSFATYFGGSFKDFELIVLDDSSTDETYQLCQGVQRHMDLKYVRIEKPANTWRDSAMILNIGIRMAASKGLIICTHPEVMVGHYTLERAFAAYNESPGAYICAKSYYLTVDQQEIVQDSRTRWDGGALQLVRSIPGFYSTAPPIAGGVDYSPIAVEHASTWESWVFGGLGRDTWREIGGMWETPAWGTVDVTFLHRRQLLKIPNVTMPQFDSYVVHQNHDDPSKNVVTPRDMDLCLATVPRFDSPAAAIGDFL